MVRIYYQVKEGIIYSKPILAGHYMCTVNIIPSTLQVIITSLETGEILFHEKSDSVRNLKIIAKKYLTNLGKAFGGEIRRRGMMYEY